MGRYAQALPLLQRALQIDPKQTANSHPQYRDMGRYAQALPLLQRALQIEEAAHGPRSTRAAAALNSLARVLQARSLMFRVKGCFRVLGLGLGFLGSTAWRASRRRA